MPSWLAGLDSSPSPYYSASSFTPAECANSTAQGGQFPKKERGRIDRPHRGTASGVRSRRPPTLCLGIRKVAGIVPAAATSSASSLPEHFLLFLFALGLSECVHADTPPGMCCF